MGAGGARRSMGTKGARRKILSTLHPNTILKPVFELFLVAKQAIFKAFCDSRVAKMACNGLKMGSFHLLLFRHPKWSRIIFGKPQF